MASGLTLLPSVPMSTTTWVIAFRSSWDRITAATLTVVPPMLDAGSREAISAATLMVCPGSALATCCMIAPHAAS